MRIIKNTTSLILSGLVFSLLAMAPAMATPNASTTAGTVKNTAQAKQMERIVLRSNQEIDRRTEALKTLADRIQLMKRLTDSQKVTIVSEVKAQIDALNSLKTKIAAETDIAALRADAQLIAKSYRIFALIIPQSHIMIAADRIVTIADTMTAVGVRLQTAITTAQAAGKDTAVSQAALADMTTKIADAKAAASEAQNIAAPLVPDNGDQAKFKANKDALKQAQSKIKAAHQSLVAARHDIQSIMQALQITGKDKNGSATSTPERGD